MALDTTPFFQSMISQPLVVCSFFGFIWGDIYTGALLGVILELIWLKLIPIGGFISQQGNYGAFAAST
ncbi:PTS sugar transporter subunit IIC, partial [candidate division KSB1 bacterium]